MSLAIAITYTLPQLQIFAQQLAEKLAIPLIFPREKDTFPILLVLTELRLELCLTHPGAPGPIFADFVGGAALHRYHHGGGCQQLLARAIGLHKKKNLTVCDLSAGLGRDAFVIACLGAKMTLIERSPIIAALLTDAWQRAEQRPWAQRLSWQLITGDSRQYLLSLTPAQRPQIIYFDPMFPGRKKTALMKKEMRILREIVGDDEDAPELLTLALQTAINRVVVKRPRLAESIPGPPPSFTLSGQSSRFDIYLVDDY